LGKVEQALLDILSERTGGEAYQSELVRISGFSRSRVSEVLSKMQRNGLVSRYPLGIGKNFNVMLNADLKVRSHHSNRARRKDKTKTLRLGFIRAAEYPFVIPFRKLLRDKFDLKLEFRVYGNGIDVIRDLSLLRLDLGISPVLTQFMFHSLGSPIKLLAPAGSGGSSLISSKKLRARNTAEPRIASSKLSTMELLMRSSVNENVLPKMSRVVYASNPLQIMKDAISGSADAACLWEPYVTILLRKGKGEFVRLMRYSDMGEHLCCALAAGNHLDSSSLVKIRRIFVESLEQYDENRDSFSAPFASLIGIERNLLEEVSNEYSYSVGLDSRLISHQFERAGLSLPAPLSVKDAITVDD